MMHVELYPQTSNLSFMLQVQSKDVYPNYHIWIKFCTFSQYVDCCSIDFALNLKKFINQIHIVQSQCSLMFRLTQKSNFTALIHYHYSGKIINITCNLEKVVHIK
ncbi:unnamed protein product (macronuclear) [Paramecium tetraurelia]|uniref:Uncharacterized protein n=1 Tax=Paramecium tetraurelia TaxID=5888 RepID=A0DPU9_PARTE|nr:uncharacterized protein GSPATT00039717001 [Paramecium tetraurelia]CAK85066.1 unnamed protein product [Paramecium tetraurelia]|eukprot:XP_001452463.1 hypothetical protein (macronuclear) [Paramecium tetraurelia strain d4-2]